MVTLCLRQLFRAEFLDSHYNFVVQKYYFAIGEIILDLALKVTQINYVSRNKLHNTSNFESWIELAWLGEKCKGKTLLVNVIFFTLHRYCTVTAQYSIGAQYPKQNMNKFSQCLDELAQKFKFL